MGSSDHLQRAARLNAVARAVRNASASGVDPASIAPIREFLAQIRALLEMDVVFIGQFEEDRRVYRCVSASGTSDVPVVEGRSDPVLETYCLLVAQGRLDPVVPDTQALPEIADLPMTGRLDIRAHVSAPIVLAGGEVFGTLCGISHRKRPDLDSQDAVLIETLAHAIACCVKDGRVTGPVWLNG